MPDRNIEWLATTRVLGDGLVSLVEKVGSLVKCVCSEAEKETVQTTLGQTAEVFDSTRVKCKWFGTFPQDSSTVAVPLPNRASSNGAASGPVGSEC